ncbi:MAG: ribosome silencing factor [Sulfurimicrobium sp.]|jgi:ribosome-associated protein|nr:ribosome silencing factor [Sulfurimicrobium sp.]
MKLEAMKQAVVAALEDIKAKDIAVLDVKHLTSMTDCMIIASGDSNRQTRALANNVIVKLKEQGAEMIGMEGEDSGEWVLVDFGQVVVHIMQPTIREHYNLEQLWGGVQAARRHQQPAAGTE